MDLSYGAGRNGAQIPFGIEAEVHCVDVDIVDVHEQLASTPARHLGHELPFGYGRISKGKVRRYVFDGDLAAQPLLDRVDACTEVFECLCGVGKRKQIVKVAAADARPTK